MSMRATALLFAVAGLVGVALAVLAIRDSTLPAVLSGDSGALTRGKDAERRPGRGEGPRLDHMRRELENGVREAPGRAWRAARLPAAVAAALLLALLFVRWRARRRRRFVRLRLVPYRSDETEAAEIVRLFESWHQQLLERWWRRIPFGQPSIALELVMQQDADGECVSRLSVVCSERLAEHARVRFSAATRTHACRRTLRRSPSPAPSCGSRSGSRSCAPCGRSTRSSASPSTRSSATWRASAARRSCSTSSRPRRRCSTVTRAGASAPSSAARSAPE